MLIPTNLDAQKRVHHPTLVFAISRFFSKNESRIFIYCTIITHHVKFNYSLQTSYNTYLNTKCISNYSGAITL